MTCLPHHEGGDPRCGWSRTNGYKVLRSTGFSRRIGDRFRLDTLIAREQAVLAGELPGRPAEPESPDDVPVAAPTRRRTRGTRRAA